MVAWAVGCGALSGSIMHHVRAEPSMSACARDPWVELAFEGDGWSVALQADMTEDLRAGLRLRGIGLCADGQGTGNGVAPVARAVLDSEGGERFQVAIEIQDALTEKRVSRNVELRRTAPDARALVLAQAVDELLRASWVELTIPNAPEPTRPPPAAVRKVLEERQGPGAPASPSKRFDMFGARVASELYLGGLELFGPDAQIAAWIDERLALSIALGVRMSPVIRSAHGTIDASAWVVSGALRVPVWPRDSRINLLGSVGGQLAALTMVGRGDYPARARTRHGIGVTAQFGLVVTWQLAGLIQLEAELGPGLALRGVTATDTAREVASTRGLHAHGALSLGGLF